MLFSSTLFLVYFLPVFFTIYFLIPKIFKNHFIVLSSILFYYWGAPTFLYILLSTIVFNFIFAHLIHNYEGKTKKLLLLFSVLSNVSFLIYYKYANFFVDNLNSIIESAGAQPISMAQIILPIGISFFTFHQLSFIIDVYREVKPPMKKLSDYALYILIFPQLIAGPIIRYNEIADQIEGRNKTFNLDEVLLGFLRFSIGLAKKVLIANVLGEEADKMFSLPVEHIDAWMAWIGALAYTFQIYFDFSGYSDMALGLAKMMGFTFPENFNHPYISKSITDFWRRWHISLSRWMRDYLYIPLGGNKVSGVRLYFNLWIVFLISGLWHGAEWTFILWGAYHGFFLAIERLFLLKYTEKLHSSIKIAFSFIVVVFGWVLFRAKDIKQAADYFKKMVEFSYKGEYELSNHVLYIFIVAIILSLYPLFLNSNATAIKNKSIGISQTLIYTLSIVVLIVLSLGEITSSNFNPFIYFKF